MILALILAHNVRNRMEEIMTGLSKSDKQMLR